MKLYIVTHNDIYSGRDYSAQPEMLLDRWFLSLDEAIDYAGGHAQIYQCDIGHPGTGIVEWVNKDINALVRDHRQDESGSDA